MGGSCRVYVMASKARFIGTSASKKRANTLEKRKSKKKKGSLDKIMVINVLMITTHPMACTMHTETIISLSLFPLKIPYK